MGGNLVTPPESGDSFVLDANVLIDYCQSDRTVLSLISRHVGVLHVVSLVLDEVRELDRSQCAALGLVPVEPELEDVITAARKRQGLSFQDHLCLILAKRYGWTCVTNDARLRRECMSEGIRILWGLEPMVRLVESRVLSTEAARSVVLCMHSRNPRYITKTIVERFMNRIEPLQ